MSDAEKKLLLQELVRIIIKEGNNNSFHKTDGHDRTPPGRVVISYSEHPMKIPDIALNDWDSLVNDGFVEKDTEDGANYEWRFKLTQSTLDAFQAIE